VFYLISEVREIPADQTNRGQHDFYENDQGKEVFRYN
jgi:hypothetical protein